MNYIFFGTPRFASLVLQKMIDAGMPPAAVICNPDRPAGRKKVITAPPVKLRAEEHGIAVLQPGSFDDGLIASLRALAPDAFVVAAYAKIIPQAVLNIPRLGTLGVHPSLLPHYRGASPLQSAILAGERETGGTIYLMDAKMDHGPVLAERTVPLDPDTETYTILEERLATLCGNLLAETLPAFMAGTAAAHPQDHDAATFTKKFSSADAFVDAADLDAATAGNVEKATHILHMVNAFSPEPGCWTMRDGIRMKILAAARGDHGALRITRIQKEGERPRDL